MYFYRILAYLSKIIFVLNFSGCIDCPEGCLDYCCRDFYYMGDYEVSVERTSTGIGFDDTGQGIDPIHIDNLMDEVEECLKEEFPKGVIPEEVKEKAMCMPVDPPIHFPLKRGCITLKIPDDWSWSCDGSEQLLNLPAHPRFCEAKGLVPTEECPCSWRTAIQARLTVLTTPNLKLAKDSIIKLVTGCANPWGHSKMSRCAKPY